MNGHVGFTSTEGQGSEFWVDLLVHEQNAQGIERGHAVLHGSPLGTAAGETHKIIYVEDNPSNIAFMRELMEELPSVELLTAPSAELGIEMIRAHRPAIVIMDVNLPGMSGIEAVQRLREIPETKDIPVIGLSAAALLRDTAKARDAGFYRYLTKPVKVDELTSVLEELLVHRRA
jgi:CheY-like chemotaxis protein